MLYGRSEYSPVSSPVNDVGRQTSVNSYDITSTLVVRANKSTVHLNFAYTGHRRLVSSPRNFRSTPNF